MRRFIIRTALLIIAQYGFFVSNVWAHTGYGMAIDRQGRVVFLDSIRNRVWRIESDGRLTALATDKHADNLVLDADGNLFVEHVNETLWKIAPDGSVTEVVLPNRRPGAGVGSLDELLAIDRDGNMYFSNENEFLRGASQIRKLMPAGQVILLAGSVQGHADGRGSQAQFRHLRAAAWGPDGALYVTDEHSVRRVLPDGMVTTVAGSVAPGFADGPGQTARFERVLGVALDAEGNVFVADTDNFRVRRISPDGHVSTVIQTRLPWKPAGVAVMGSTVYVLERQFMPMPVIVQEWFTTHRVRQIGPDGTIATVVMVGGGGGILLTGVLAALVLAAWWWWRRRRRKAAGQGQTL